MTTTVIKSRQIPFSAQMVRALLEGRKTQTRRIIKPHPPAFVVAASLAHDNVWNFTNGKTVGLLNAPTKCPYGKPGDRLWVRENFRLPKSLDAMNCTQVAERMLDLGYTAPWAPIRYEADGATINATELTDSPLSLWGGDWGRLRVARFMPRWASRITLEITDVRVQRVEEISEQDARAEGPEPNWVGPLDDWSPEEHGYLDSTPEDVGEEGYFRTGREAFLDLFYNINKRAPRGQNPWVWALTFKVIA